MNVIRAILTEANGVGDLQSHISLLLGSGFKVVNTPDPIHQINGYVLKHGSGHEARVGASERSILTSITHPRPGLNSSGGRTFTNLKDLAGHLSYLKLETFDEEEGEEQEDSPSDILKRHGFKDLSPLRPDLTSDIRHLRHPSGATATVQTFGLGSHHTVLYHNGERKEFRDHKELEAHLASLENGKEKAESMREGKVELGDILANTFQNHGFGDAHTYHNHTSTGPERMSAFINKDGISGYVNHEAHTAHVNEPYPSLKQKKFTDPEALARHLRLVSRKESAMDDYRLKGEGIIGDTVTKLKYKVGLGSTSELSDVFIKHGFGNNKDFKMPEKYFGGHSMTGFRHPSGATGYVDHRTKEAWVNAAYPSTKYKKFSDPVDLERHLTTAKKLGESHSIDNRNRNSKGNNMTGVVSRVIRELTIGKIYQEDDHDTGTGTTNLAYSVGITTNQRDETNVDAFQKRVFTVRADSPEQAKSMAAAIAAEAGLTIRQIDFIDLVPDSNNDVHNYDSTGGAQRADSGINFDPTVKAAVVPPSAASIPAGGNPV